MQYRFDGFEMDIDRLELRLQGEVRPLEPQVFDLLRLFLENRNRLTTRDELVAKVWGGRSISESAIDSRIHAARLAVDDDGRNQRRIKTVSKRGYRFVADVDVIDSHDGDIPKPDKTLIAVLPFENKSDDLEQESFADAVAENIIAALSRFHRLSVVSRSSSFAYRGSEVDLRQVATELNVQYIIEGSVRRAGNRLRIAVRLIDASSDSHIWAERFDGELNHIFSVQDEITELVAMAVAPELHIWEMERARRRKLPDLRVREMLARANWHVWRFTEEDVGVAEAILNEALEHDPDDARIYVALSRCFSMASLYGWRRSSKESLSLALETARKAVDLDKYDEVAHARFGICLFHSRRHDDAARRLETAIRLNPNQSLAVGNLGTVLIHMRQHDRGLELLRKVIRQSPKDPALPFYLVDTGFHYFLAGRYEEAVEWAAKSVHETATFPTGYCLMASAHGLLGNDREARAAYNKFRMIASSATIMSVSECVPFIHRRDVEGYVEGLRCAGMPEQ